MRKPIVAGNWKCHKTSKEAIELVRQLRIQLETVREVEIVVCPPFTSLHPVKAALDSSVIKLGAQDLFWEAQGPFTGEVSALMLEELGCGYCIIGHSERRQQFGETDEQINKKVLAALRHRLVPILCLGETLPQREQGETFEVIGRQFQSALAGLSSQEVARVVIAYEPVWAIGTGRNASPTQAQEAQAFIRQRLQAGWGMDAARAVRIQYGGSVTPANAVHLMQQPDVDGALVGGSSLCAESFGAIVRAAACGKGASR